MKSGIQDLVHGRPKEFRFPENCFDRTTFVFQARADAFFSKGSCGRAFDQADASEDCLQKREVGFEHPEADEVHGLSARQ